MKKHKWFSWKFKFICFNPPLYLSSCLFSHKTTYIFRTDGYFSIHCVQIWQKRREKLLKLKLCIFVLSRVHLECTNMILVKSDPTKVIKAKLKALRLPKSRLCTIIFVFYAAFESVCIELQSLWDLSWLKVLKAKKATRNIQN